MSNVIESLEREQLRKVPAFEPGDRVRVHFQVVEGNRRRTQVFEGVVIKRQGTGVRETFTVRKQSFGVGVERTFPLHSPKIEKIEVASRGDVRRAKLYYLRDRIGKAARVRERQYTGGAAEADVALAPETGATDEQGAQADAEVVPAPEEAAAEATEAAEAAEAAEATEAATDADTAEATEAAADAASPEGEQPEGDTEPEASAEEPAGEEAEPADKG